MATVLIFGCGWLGSQLGVALAEAGHRVYGSRRSEQNLLTLPPQIQPLWWDGLSLFDGAIQALLPDSWVILAMPPAAQRDGGSAYLESLQLILSQSSRAKRLVLCSSTGVYAGLAGHVNESAAPGPEPRAALLWQAEQLVRQHPAPYILRLAGLVGPGRHPASFTRHGVMAGPEQPVNLVHSHDVCRWVCQLLTASGHGFPQVVNLSAPLTATKAEFYTAACVQAAVAVPQFVAAVEPGRTVDASLSQRDTGFVYRHHGISGLCS
ncbi:MAG: epimerase [Rheinheimera sp.]|nr:MAG: epimerase [Rheinheimera sp.]